MLSLLRVLLFLLPLSALGAQPTRAALRRALEADERASVRVVGGARQGKAGRGTLVGAGGKVLTVVDFISLDDARVQQGAELHEAEVVSADAQSRLAIVSCSALSQRVPVAASPAALHHTGWAIAVVPGKREPVAKAVRLLAEKDGTFLIPTRLAPGTPLYDDQGRLLGLITRAAANGSRALSISALRAHARLAEGAAGRNTPAR